MGGITSTGASQFANISGSAGSQTNKKDNVGRDEFLQLLITQLKNQAPEAPLDSKEFAVQLAQFTQVEKLISIDEQLTKQSENVSSMAGYLGQQVVLNSSDVLVKGGKGGQLQVDLGQDAQNVRVQLIDGTGKVVGEKVIDNLNKGKQLITLDQLAVPDGEYQVKVSATSRFGAGVFNPATAVAGIVSGFIPGPDPKLIVGGREISVGEIREVSLPA